MVLLAMLMAVGGCSVSRTLRPAGYTVQRGDTLVEIARHYNIDWHDLARWNHIDSPYRLDVGERLTLKPYPQLDYAHMSGARHASGNQSASRAGQSASKTSPVGRARSHAKPSAAHTSASSTSSEKRAQAHAEGSSEDNASRGQHGAASGDRSATNKQEHSIDSASSSKATRQTAVKAGGPSVDGWQWPASGSLLRSYDSSARRRGIEIGGKVGSPIYAASSGTVVYNGSGLKGYGKLIIIKHDEHYLSAYGFIERSRVKKGQTVSAGSQIADMGRGPGNKPMLRFEIRHDGDPMDPQKALPDR